MFSALGDLILAGISVLTVHFHCEHSRNVIYSVIRNVIYSADSIDPRALVLLERQCQSSSWVEQVLLGPSGGDFLLEDHLPQASCASPSLIFLPAAAKKPEKFL